jgi:hypothetical protein
MSRPEGMKDEPDLSAEEERLVHIAIEAVKAAFVGEPQAPRFVMVVELPPVGRIAIASTGDDEVDTHRMLAMAAGAVRAGMTPATKRRARQLWDAERAGFERRN